ncbi:MAG TPA: HAD hydrolase family protein [Gemmatimonadaceae bacterium]|nr:HAD hydrolase family protein [Gemmatimonadaceae bacterium]
MIDRETAHRIRLVGLDVDGVLTDGGLYIGDVNGHAAELKRYDIQDGLGIHFLRMAGIKVAIVTGRESESVRIRARELAADELVQDRQARKLPAFVDILERHGIAAADAAFIGDDFPDMAIFRMVGLPVAVGNAVPEIAAASKLRLHRAGGRGAVREFAEILLKARGEWEEVVERYVAERSVLEGAAR